LGLRKTEWVRRLTPIELERLNGFPDDHTKGVPDSKRAFFMGNALVCGIVEVIGKALHQEGMSKQITESSPLALEH